jgi:molybdate transport repressor ModE-like protein
MSPLATMPPSSNAATCPIRWGWDFGVGLSDLESNNLMALLGAVREFETLGRAATAAGLSYRAAWGLLRDCETRFGRSLVLKARGKGSTLSEFGEQLYMLDSAARASFGELHATWGQRLQEVLSLGALRQPEYLRIAASHDLALADWLENGRHVQVDIFWRGSEEALLALSRGECDAAGFHLPAFWNAEQAAAWLGRWLKPRQFAFFPVMRRQHGLLVAAGNPFSVNSLADVARLGLRMVNRQRGSGTRGMIDQLLAANGLQAEQIPGYAHEEFTHDAVATAIASGQADVGFGIQAAATRYDLGFIPLSRDLYCLVARTGIVKSPAMRQLMRRFQGTTFHDRLVALAGYQPVASSHDFLAWEAFISSLGDDTKAQVDAEKSY